MGNKQRVPTPEEQEELNQNYDSNCRRAAEAISNANCFLLATGAGFSADSGLAVYKDIANVPAYHKRKLTYADICQTHWIKDDPEIFYGFWGTCFNDYRETKPHQG